MKEEAKAMSERIEQLEEENRRLQEDAVFYKSRLATAEKQGRSAAEGKQRDEEGDASSSSRVRQLEAELREAREENEKRVSDTAQFQQMKKLMQSQAQNLTDMRRRLLRYEPDDAKGE